jgi:protein-L-isoaspartate(D-aspartate) O-methyltransferase
MHVSIIQRKAVFPGRMIRNVSSQCPECGFDLEAGETCRVCGHRPAADVSAKPRSQERPRKRGSIAILLVSMGGLLVLLVAFIVVDMRGRAENTQRESAFAPSTPLVRADAAPPEPSAPIPEPTPLPDPDLTPKKADPAARTHAKAAGAARPQIAPRNADKAPVLLSPETEPFDITARGDSVPVTGRSAFVAWMRVHTDQKEKFLIQKWDLAQVILKTKGITHPRVLEAFLRAPREFFCRDTRRAYENAVLPIGYGQTISGPHMVARMTDYLDPQPEQKVLEIGTGSGYQSAVLSELSNHVYTIEIVGALARETDAIYRKHIAKYPEFRNITRKVDDGYYGWAEYAPFDRIIVTCGIDHVPPELLRQLAPEGIMVIPVGPPSGQTILRITKHVESDGSVRLDREDIFQGKRKEIFVPFTAGTGGIHKDSSDETTR